MQLYSHSEAPRNKVKSANMENEFIKSVYIIFNLCSLVQLSAQQHNCPKCHQIYLSLVTPSQNEVARFNFALYCIWTRHSTMSYFPTVKKKKKKKYTKIKYKSENKVNKEKLPEFFYM